MAPEYTPRDLAWYTGMMLGMAAVYVAIDTTGVIDGRIVKLIVSGLCGLGLAFVCQLAYDRMTSGQ